MEFVLVTAITFIYSDKLTFLFIIWNFGCDAQPLGNIPAEPEPAFILEPPDLMPWFEGAGSLRIPCVARFANVSWITSDGQPVDMVPGVRYILSDGTLVLEGRSLKVGFNTNVSYRTTNPKSFRCKATNNIGALVSREVTVEYVDENQMAIRANQLGSATFGNSVVLQCLSSAGKRLLRDRIVWYRNERPIYPETSLDGIDLQYVTPNGGTDLILSNFKEKDISTFSCSLRDSANIGHPIKIIITDTPSNFAPKLINKDFATVKVRETELAMLFCFVHGSPSPIFRWTHSLDDSDSTFTEASRTIAISNFMMIRNVTASDGGTWYCKSSNSFGDLLVEITLEVLPKLQASLEPHSVVTSTGKKVVLNCSLRGVPNGAIEWFHNGRRLKTADYYERLRFQNDKTLLIEQVRQTDDGFYQCMVRNYDESAESYSRVVVRDTTPQFKLTFRPGVLKTGQHISLQCSVFASPNPKVIWKLDGLDLSSSLLQRYQFKQYSDNDGSIVSGVNITDIQHEDGGFFECNATNTAGSITHGARIEVYGPPYIRYIAPLHAVTGSNVTVHCPYSGYPISSVIWTKRESQVVSDRINPNYKGENLNNILQLKKIQPEDAGTYTCTVVGTTGELARRDIQLHVHNPPVVIPFNFPLNILEGGSTQTTCTVSSGDRPIYFSWYKDGNPIPPELKVEHRNMGFFSLLIFEIVWASHNGSYTCSAANNAAATNFTADLIVKVPPQWIAEPQNTSTISGSSLMVPCNAQGYPKPDVTWLKYKDFELLDAKSIVQSDKMAVLEDGSIFISTIKSTDEGWYKCTVDNKVGKTLTKTVFIGVNEPPYIYTISNNMTLRNGAKAVMSCYATGDKPLVIAWLKGSNRLHSDYKRVTITEFNFEDKLNSKVIIEDITSEDGGLYKCMVENQFGRNETAINLSVQERPKSPVNIQVMEVSSRTVSLTWKRGHDGGSPIQSYLLQHQPMTGIQEDSMKTWSLADATNVTLLQHQIQNDATGNENALQVTVKGFKPATVYMFRIMAINQIDHSLFTEPIMAKTKEEAPSESPRSIKILARNPRELQVEWKVPPANSWNGALLGYVIYWKEDVSEINEQNDKLSEKSAQIRGAIDSNFTISNLGYYRRYLVSVSAYNSAGAGPRSFPVVGITLEGVPEVAPTNVSCIALSPVSLKIWYFPLPQNRIGGALRGYKILYLPIQDFDDGLLENYKNIAEIQRSILPEIILNNLKSHTKYSITINAYTGSGDGPSSDLIICSTNEDVPEAPAAIKATTLSRSSIVVTWLPPINANGNIIHYTVYMKEIAPRQYEGGKSLSFKVPINNSEEIEVHPSICLKQHNYLMGGLREGTPYEFSISASTKIGEGPSTRSSVQQPSSSVPAKIASFGGTIRVVHGDTASMECLACGSSNPKRQWYKDSIPILTNPRVNFINKQGDLVIQNVDSIDAGTYTCAVHNEAGSDNIKIHLIPLTPPPAPRVTLISAQRHSLRISAIGPTGSGLQILYRSLMREGMWKNITLQPGATECSLLGLECATVYQIYAISQGRRNTAVSSFDRSMLTVRTVGGPPIAPKDIHFLAINDTAVSMDTSAWVEYNGGDAHDNCGEVRLRVAVKERSDRSWNFESVVIASGLLFIPQLSPATWYRLKVTATNDAGTTVSTYNFATTTETGNIIAPPPDLDAYFNEEIIEPLTLAVICGSFVLVSAIFVITIYNVRRNGCQCDGCSQEANLSSGKNIQTELPHPAFLTLNSKDNSVEKYEISPYATFNPQNECASTTSYSPEYVINLGSYPQSNADQDISRHKHTRRKCPTRHSRTSSQGRTSSGNIRIPLYVCEQHHEETELSPTEAEQISYHNNLRFDPRTRKMCHLLDNEEDVRHQL